MSRWRDPGPGGSFVIHPSLAYLPLETRHDLEPMEAAINPPRELLSEVVIDLLEGLMGRAGLATDITLVEDYPQNYTIHILRQQRWIRGDWQLLPWLLNPRQFGVKFSLMDRWKIFDNLRRSLMRRYPRHAWPEDPRSAAPPAPRR